MSARQSGQTTTDFPYLGGASQFLPQAADLRESLVHDLLARALKIFVTDFSDERSLPSADPRCNSRNVQRNLA
jgi:hypothetical protein